MLLASLGVSAYQERVPLQLLDFAYRYTSNILQDAVHLTTEGYAGEPGPGGGGNKGPAEVNTVNLSAVRLSIASRLHYQFQTGLPKEFLMDMAAERNRVALPGASRGFDGAGNRAPAQQQANQSVLLGGMRLPPERFCLTGSGWTMREEWESEGEEELGPEGQEEEDEDAMERDDEAENEQKRGSSAAAVGTKEEADEGFGEEDDEDGKMEDVFGEDTTMGQEDGDGDRSMGGA
jgi:transcription initiation factor TFIID subunit 9B